MTEAVISPPTTDREKEVDNSLVFSYLTLRNLIGICGILLPIVLFLTTKKGEADRRIEPSISDYYYTSNGDILVVLLSVLGVFLFTYKGYKWQEKALTTIAAICGIGIGFSPISTQHANSLSIHIANKTVPTLFGIERHVIFTLLFFVSLSIITLKYFPRTDSTFKTIAGRRTQKGKRNMVYKICGWIMITCIVSLGAYFIFHPKFVKTFPIIFVFETIAIWAFGISWITKGETLWPDGEHYLKKAYRKLTSGISAK